MHADIIVPGDPALLRIRRWGLFAGEAFIVRAAAVLVTVGGVDDVSCGDRGAVAAAGRGGEGKAWDWAVDDDDWLFGRRRSRRGWRAGLC